MSSPKEKRVVLPHFTDVGLSKTKLFPNRRVYVIGLIIGSAPGYNANCFRDFSEVEITM
jgi:hypothetical protein